MLPEYVYLFFISLLFGAIATEVGFDIYFYLSCHEAFFEGLSLQVLSIFQCFNQVLLNSLIWRLESAKVDNLRSEFLSKTIYIYFIFIYCAYNCLRRQLWPAPSDISWGFSLLEKDHSNIQNSKHFKFHLKSWIQSNKMLLQGFTTWKNFNMG